ncbi:LOW QUALITY PROTEIN: hypothetical protein ACHAXM_010998 [Skeletonema potamos]
MKRKHGMKVGGGVVIFGMDSYTGAKEMYENARPQGACCDLDKMLERLRSHGGAQATPPATWIR